MGARGRLLRLGIQPAQAGLRYWEWPAYARETADGTGESSWTDIGPEAVPLIQGTVSLRPLMQRGANGINGWPALLSDATDDLLRDNATTLSAPFTGADRPCTWLIVAQLATAGSQGVFMSFGRAASSNPSFRLGLSSTDNLRITRSDDTAAQKSVTSPLVVAVGVPFVALCRFSGTEGDIWVNGVQVARGDLDVGTATFDLFSTFARRGPTTGNRLPGKIAHLTQFVGTPDDYQARLLSRGAMNLYRIPG